MNTRPPTRRATTRRRGEREHPPHPRGRGPLGPTPSDGVPAPQSLHVPDLPARREQVRAGAVHRWSRTRRGSDRPPERNAADRELARGSRRGDGPGRPARGRSTAAIFRGVAHRRADRSFCRGPVLADDSARAGHAARRRRLWFGDRQQPAATRARLAFRRARRVRRSRLGLLGMAVSARRERSTAGGLGRRRVPRARGDIRCMVARPEADPAPRRRTWSDARRRTRTGFACRRASVRRPAAHDPNSALI